MRSNLKKSYSQRLKFRGTFERYGKKTNWKGYPERTILLKDITKVLQGILVSDHLWFGNTKGFQALGELKQGDVIEFDARVRDYVKGYVNHREFIDDRMVDYKLNNPTKFKLISRGK